MKLLAGALAILLAAPLAAKPPAEEWPTYHGDYSGRHYSPLTQINAGNVDRLTLAWVHRLDTSPRGAITGGAGSQPPPGDQGIPIKQIKAIPLMVDGVLYFAVPNHAYAVDARTGQTVWHYYWKSDRSAIGNRGVGKYGDWLYFETPDNHIVSLDAATGKERWHKQIASVRQQYFSTPAPIVIRNHVIVGMGGDALDVPAWLESRDPETGEIQWKWYTTPRRGEPGIETWPNEQTAANGGGMPWQPPTYDPELNLLYVPTGNPNPVLDGRRRPGDNLYTASIVALDVDTGKMKWHFQGSPHDTHDWDGTQVPVLFDAEIDGKPRKLLAQANRNGFFFVLDRTNGQAIVSKPFIETANWFKGVDNKGRPIPNPDKEPQIPGVLVSPSTDGAANYPAPSFNPDTGLFYINATESWSLYYLTERVSNAVGWGGALEHHTGVFDSALRALDYRTGEVKWEHRYPGLGFWSSTYPGMLSTAGKLLFTGDPVGNFIAYDPANGPSGGKVLWHTNLGSIVCNSPITYMLDGRQYVVVASGDALYAFSLYNTADTADTGSRVPEGFSSIFNGRDLTGWHVSRTTHQGSTPDVRVEDGALVLRQQPYGQGGLLLTDRRYKNFELYLEAKPDWGCNGGIMFRSTEGGSAYQIELDQGNGTGNLFGDMLNISRPARAVNIDKAWKYDEWNSFLLRVEGDAPRIRLAINGVPMWDVTQERNDLAAGARDGMIGLQVHWSSTTAPPVALCCEKSWRPGGAHRFRNIAIKELPPTTTNSIGMELVLIKPGTLHVGRFEPNCPSPSVRDTPDQDPRARWTQDDTARCEEIVKRERRSGFTVTLPDPYYIGKYEVTQDEWMKVMGADANPSAFQGQRHPVDSVTWNEAQRFVQRLNQREKTTAYRLPTEFEWEYAARAGASADPTWDEIREVAWEQDITTATTHPVGLKKPNAWGLHDMLGNVWEWVSDYYNEKIFADPTPPQHGTTHVLKGGGFLSDVKNTIHSTHAAGPGDGFDVGFRIVRVPPAAR